MYSYFLNLLVTAFPRTNRSEQGSADKSWTITKTSDKIRTKALRYSKEVKKRLLENILCVKR